MTQVMLDLETMGKNKTAAIISIGAVGFTDEGLVEHAEFHQEVNLQSCIDAGLKVDGSTVMWWLQQSQEAREVFKYNDQAKPLHKVLVAFSEWCNAWDVEEIWGNGVGFDNTILESAYNITGIQLPWKFWNDRCYRTMKNMYPHIQLERPEELVLHNALDDAKYQALHLLKILKEVNGEGGQKYY